jgi:hypothetical protein
VVEDKIITDAKIIKSYCKAKFGYKLTNLLGLTPEEQEDKQKKLKEGNSAWVGIVEAFDCGYKPHWQHKYDIIIVMGLKESELVDFRQLRLNIILDSENDGD